MKTDDVRPAGYWPVCRHGNASNYGSCHGGRVFCLDCGETWASAAEWQRAAVRAMFIPLPRAAGVAK